MQAKQMIKLSKNFDNNNQMLTLSKKSDNIDHWQCTDWWLFGALINRITLILLTQW